MPAALEELKRCAGTQFDPQMVRALVRGLERHGWSAVTTAVTADEPGIPGPRSESGKAVPGRPRPSGGLDRVPPPQPPADGLGAVPGPQSAADRRG